LLDGDCRLRYNKKSYRGEPCDTKNKKVKKRKEKAGEIL
jgi:hypothetical protein